ncbi:hypothetical protein [Streptomyces gilvosporeus]|uniref:hypothetical protein n=1 Tax=Streptomyces gilvosporeus TaxID=553510 RepID=UPI000D1A1C39|nr:hypothetical protein [Streptomyces gilvosporeus]
MTAETVLDAVALAYADDPTAVEALLLDLAGAAEHRGHMATYHDATDYGREDASAAADAARDELLAVLDLPLEQNGVAA